jgi:L-lactate dehydrogenase (cytochrome)
MPAAFATLPNGGLPQGQRPLQSAADAEAVNLPEISWDEVKKKADEGLAWLVVDGIVYDVTVMRDVHPGGAAILRKWAGKDATGAFRKAKHTNGTQVFALNFRIGKVVGTPPAVTEREPDAVAEAGV